MISSVEESSSSCLHVQKYFLIIHSGFFLLLSDVSWIKITFLREKSVSKLRDYSGSFAKDSVK